MKAKGGPKRRNAAEPPARPKPTPSGPGDWRDKTLARIRRLIRQALPDVAEAAKWKKPSSAMRGVPVWSLGGIICTGEMYTGKVKLTFARGAALPDPAGLFNAGLDGGTRRAIDLHEGDTIDEKAFKDLVRAAAALNASMAEAGAGAPARPRTPARARPRTGRA